MYTAGSVIIPSMGSVFNEFALKKHMDTSVHLQNFFLYFYGACFNFLFVGIMLVATGDSFASVFQGYSAVRNTSTVLFLRFIFLFPSKASSCTTDSVVMEGM
jgi:hypothetical protein